MWKRIAAIWAVSEQLIAIAFIALIGLTILGFVIAGLMWVKRLAFG